MKALSKKSLILVLSLVFALSALMFAFSFKSASATENASVTHFKVMEQATIRVGQVNGENNTSGIRFRVQMDYDTANYVKSNDDVKLGFIITVKQYYDEAIAGAEDLTTVDFHTAVTKYVSKTTDGIIAEENTIYYSEDGNEVIDWNGEQIDGNGYYYANGAVQNIKEANIEYGYVAIGFIQHADGAYTYAYPSSDFSRTYKQVANKAYMAGQSNVTKAAYLATLGTTDNPIQITEDADLYTISGIVAKGETFDGANFVLMNDLAVDYDFTPIAESFAGEVDQNDKTISIYNNKDINAFAGGEATSVNNTKLFNATEKMTANTHTATVDSCAAEFVENGELPTNVYAYNSLQTVSEDAVKFTEIGSYYLKLNYTKDELTALYESNTYNAVRFKYLIANASDVAIDSSDTLMNFSIRDMSFTVNTSYQTYNRQDTITEQWISTLIDIDDFIARFDEDGETIYMGELSGTSGNVYVADMELVNDTSTLFSAEIVPPANAMLNVKKTPGSSGSVIDNNIASNKSGYVTNSTMLGYTGISGDCPTTDALYIKHGSQCCMYLQLRWTAEEIEKYATLGNYQGVKVTFMRKGTYGAPSGGLLNDYSGKTYLNQWITHVFTLEEFTQWVGYVYEGTNTFTPAGNWVYMFQPAYQKPAPTTYISDISLTQESAS